MYFGETFFFLTFLKLTTCQVVPEKTNLGFSSTQTWKQRSQKLFFCCLYEYRKSQIAFLWAFAKFRSRCSPLENVLHWDSDTNSLIMILIAKFKIWNFFCFSKSALDASGRPVSNGETWMQTDFIKNLTRINSRINEHHGIIANESLQLNWYQLI